LDALYLLTCADIMGTNPKLWNGWKAKLLSDLYTATRVALRRGLENPVHAAERLQAAQATALELLRGEGAGRAQVQKVWQSFPQRALLRHTPDEIRFQTQAILAHERANDPYVIAIRPITSAGSFELFVRVPDRFGLFAMITSTLDRFGMAVVGARIASNAAGQTHDSFQLLDTEAASQHQPRARALDLQMHLRLALMQEEYRPRAAKRAATRQQKHFQFAPHIEISDSDARSSDADLHKDIGTQTLSLICPDTYGLLARVAIVLFEQKLRVHTARIATFGERAEDFFQISEIDGSRLSAERSAALIAALHDALST
jgi:[protein-PII] uridylyltransferase